MCIFSAAFFSAYAAEDHRDVKTIYQIQNESDPGHPPLGSEVTIENVVVTAMKVNRINFWVEETGAGQWSGIMIYDPSGLAPADMAVGDELTITGITAEYYDVTEIEASAVTRTNTEQTVPGPDEVNSADIGTGGALAENYESVLVRISDAEVTDQNPDAPSDFGEFEVDGVLRIDDLLFEHNPALGANFNSITGIHYYSYSNFKLEPRDCWDYSPNVCIPADHTIYEIQDVSHPSHPSEGAFVRITGVIVTAVTENKINFWVEETAGGEWSGILVHDPNSLGPEDLDRGDELTISGIYSEYYDVTELEASNIVRTATDQRIPGPDVVDSADIGTGGSLAENYESVLVQINSPSVTDTNPDAPDDFGEFEVDGVLRISDYFIEHNPDLGTIFLSITGIHYYSYGEYKLNPRDCLDYDPDICAPLELTVYQIQNPSDPDHPAEASLVRITDVIVTAKYDNNLKFWVEEPGAGQWSGILIFDPDGYAPSDLAIGDQLTVQGLYDEYYQLSQIQAQEITRTATGQTAPGPDLVNSVDIADGGALAENYEGVFVRIADPVVTNVNPDAPDDYGEFEVDDVLRVDDLFFLYNPVLDESFDHIDGIHHFEFGQFKLEPRSCYDFSPDVCNPVPALTAWSVLTLLLIIGFILFHSISVQTSTIFWD